MESCLRRFFSPDENFYIYIRTEEINGKVWSGTPHLGIKTLRNNGYESISHDTGIAQLVAFSVVIYVWDRTREDYWNNRRWFRIEPSVCWPSRNSDKISMLEKSAVPFDHRDVTGKFFWGGKVIFPEFFPGVKCFFPVENFRFGRPMKSEKQKKKKKKKKGLSSFANFPSFHFQLSTFLFIIPSFLLHFPLFSLSLFPDRSAKISRSEVWGGGTLPLPPPLRHCLIWHFFRIFHKRA